MRIRNRLGLSSGAFAVFSGIFSVVLGLGGVVTLGSVARAADPVPPRIGPERGAHAKVEAFLKGLPEAEVATWRARLKSGEVSDRDFLHRFLLEKDAGYRAAVASYDRDGANPEDFAKLAATKDASPLGRALQAHAT